MCEELNESLYVGFIGDSGRISSLPLSRCSFTVALLLVLHFDRLRSRFSATYITPTRARSSITATAHSTAEEVQEMIDEADRDNDGKINQREFLRIMKKRGDNPLDDLSSDED